MESKATSIAVLSKKDTASSTCRTHCLGNQICNEKKYTLGKLRQENYELAVSTGCTSKILLRERERERVEETGKGERRKQVSHLSMSHLRTTFRKYGVHRILGSYYIFMEHC